MAALGMLAASIYELHRKIDEPINNNAMFIAQFLADLLDAGATLSDIERELRKTNSRVFLIALPMTKELDEQCTLYRPDVPDQTVELKYHLWIGFNGAQEAEHMLREHALIAEENLWHLDATGFLQQRDDGTSQRQGKHAPPELDEILKWLLLDAESWAGIRDTIREYFALLTTAASLETLDKWTEAVKAQGVPTDRFIQLRDLLQTARDHGLETAFASSEKMVLEALLALLSAPTWEAAADVIAVNPDELSSELARQALAKMADDPNYSQEQIAILHAHRQFLEDTQQDGIAVAVERAVVTAPEKLGTPLRESLVAAYLGAEDFTSAAEVLFRFETELLQVPIAELATHSLALKDPARFTELRGLFDVARERGTKDAYELWAELHEIAHAVNASDNELIRATERLQEIAASTKTLARERALELLLVRYEELRQYDDQLEVAKTLLATRSAATRAERAADDRVNLGIAYSRVGRLREAEQEFLAATSAIEALREPFKRAALWFKIGYFFGEFKQQSSDQIAYYRRSVEDFRADASRLESAYVLNELATIYADLDRPHLAAMYATMANEQYSRSASSLPCIFGDRPTIFFEIQLTLAKAQISLGQTDAALERLTTVLSIHPVEDDTLMQSAQRLAFFAELRAGHLNEAEGRRLAWLRSGENPASVVAEALVALARAGVSFEFTGPAQGIIGPAGVAVAPMDPAEPALSTVPLKLADVANAVTQLGGDQGELHRTVGTGSAAELSIVLLATLGVTEASDSWDRLLAKRVFGKLEAEAMAAMRARVRATQPPAPSLPALEPSSSWDEVVMHYGNLRVWEMPDLAVYGPILDHYVGKSRFGWSMRINPPALSPESLDFFFFRSDPEDHLVDYIDACAYFPDGEFILCSLPFLENLYGAIATDWSAHREQIKRGLQDDWDTGDLDGVSDELANMIRAREAILLEWIIAHEVGHAHHRHTYPTNIEIATALENEADTFFLQHLGDDYVDEILQSLFGQLNILYRNECLLQHGRLPKGTDLRLSDEAKASGHVPVVFRAIALLQVILAKHPYGIHMEYIRKFDRSIRARRTKTL
ncbi:MULTISPECIES: hypothetical protein [Pseudarthrobacter]|uniref:hypothetical protein n=1 Tax=Pseudarthrobacter TaxID=1742993 RepID=UPI0013DD2224|nr:MULTISPECIES: hypothetical protein [Pseudarthrobacter]MDQ0000139.1 tetratricopeptide (TPR) repeat protein [Pseudarthrobacter sulfonivorans]